VRLRDGEEGEKEERKGKAGRVSALKLMEPEMTQLLPEYPCWTRHACSNSE